ncbi:unnamed protein product [Rotaria sordida]|uniref:Uncharacterized protein n=1 Tax=Rotaria sordida TaxID=392033 RepID=A0A814SPU3_9BILA|nr:unnamed protein product [Rotaria sordida]CAF1007657.1 unnamed protein product [Rotaria sordida]CAF1110338.1 unnamed protein product [Rotaria sordida]CAF1149348.1 unnamed protein product [Rotaria sordida]CAF1153744.1 unnamed protein product [Rotaria sordida]
MNLTNDSGGYDNDKNTSSDEDEDNNKKFDNPPSILIESFLSDNNDNDELDRCVRDDDDDNDDDDDDDDVDGDDDDDDGTDIENHFYSKKQITTQNRLCSLLRQSHRLVELKLNIFPKCLLNQNQSLRHALSDSDMSKRSHHYQNNQQEQDQQQSILQPSLSSNHFAFSTNRSHRLYLPSSFLFELETQITNWLQASIYLIDSISTSTYHRRCWPQLLLTYFIERSYTNLEFIRCTHSLSLLTVEQDSCSVHKHGCVPEEDAYKLCSILQKGSRFNIDSIIFDHIRRIIVIKSLQEMPNDNSNLQQVYVKQLKSLKQSLIHQQSSVMNIDNNNRIISVASIYSKLLLFLSSLYSIKAETMQILFCQHLLHNPTYSYLVTS